MLNHPVMTKEGPDKQPPQAEENRDPLLSDEPTIELVIRARAGDRQAVEALLQRCLPALKRWAHGRLPAAARARDCPCGCSTSRPGFRDWSGAVTSSAPTSSCCTWPRAMPSPC